MLYLYCFFTHDFLSVTFPKYIRPLYLTKVSYHYTPPIAILSFHNGAMLVQCSFLTEGHGLQQLSKVKIIQTLLMVCTSITVSCTPCNIITVCTSVTVSCTPCNIITVCTSWKVGMGCSNTSLTCNRKEKFRS